MWGRYVSNALISGRESWANSAILQVLSDQIDNLLANPEKLENIPYPIIYNRLLDPNLKGASVAPASRKSLREEGQTLLFAGSDTVGHVITSGVFNILEQPEIYDRLVAELKEAWPVLQDAPLLRDLEKLPYLVCESRGDLMLVQPQFTEFFRLPWSKKAWEFRMELCLHYRGLSRLQGRSFLESLFQLGYCPTFSPSKDPFSS